MSASLIHTFFKPINNFILCFLNIVNTVLHFLFVIDLTNLLQHPISLTLSTSQSYPPHVVLLSLPLDVFIIFIIYVGK